MGVGVRGQGGVWVSLLVWAFGKKEGTAWRDTPFE